MGGCRARRRGTTLSRDDEFRPLDWVAEKIPRSEAGQWWAGGFTLAEALRWRERFGAEEAAKWREAGIRTPAEARSWRVAGVDAGDAAGWRDAGIDFAEAAAWHEFGYSLEEARRLKAEGKTPSESFRGRVQKMSSRPSPGRGRLTNIRTRGSVSFSSSWSSSEDAAHRFLEKVQVRRNSGLLIHGYMQRQWFDDEAVAWATHGIEAADAATWKEFGITPADAVRLKDSGQTPAATLRAWWNAGIPADEVAAWLGAGFTPEEAAAQRAQGVTADRAAVLRALRGLDADG